MDKREIQRKHKKILNHINHKYGLKFEKINFQNSTFLTGIRANKSIWIYMDGGELRIEESHFSKGARYKRKQTMKNFELNDEKYREIEKQMNQYLVEKEMEEKEWKLKNMFDGQEEKGRNFVNSNMMQLLEYVGKVKELEGLQWMKEELVLQKIGELFQGTEYERKERYVPLLQGLENHFNYDVGLMTSKKKSSKLSVLKTASNKIIYISKDADKLRVFNTEKEFVKAYEENPANFD